MKTMTHHHTTGKTRTPLRGLAGLLSALLLAPVPLPAVAEDSYQLGMLFQPTESQRAAEARGRVMIYDGLDEQVVERALDEQFERIDSMMFVRTRHSEPDGDAVYDDDGC